MTAEAAPNVAVRFCGDCTLCCKVFAVPPVDDKPRDKWCRHCKPGKGCAIWQDRPQFCRDFHCLWVKDARLEAAWKPNVSKFVMNWASETQLNITCDPGSPMAHRKEPYWTALRDSARRFAAEGKHIVIHTGAQKFALLPDGERLLGPRDAFVEFRVVSETRFGHTAFFVEIKDGDAVRRVA